MSVPINCPGDSTASNEMSDPVTLSLFPKDHSQPRHFTFSSSNNNILSIGRASKRGPHERIPAHDNGWFESRVMSRDHAELSFNPVNQTVQIKDLGSTHGTWLNNVKLTSHQRAVILNEDIIRFGIDVERNDVTFPALTMRSKISYRSQYARPALTSMPFTYTMFRDSFNGDKDARHPKVPSLSKPELEAPLHVTETLSANAPVEDTDSENGEYDLLMARGECPTFPEEWPYERPNTTLPNPSEVTGDKITMQDILNPIDLTGSSSDMEGNEQAKVMDLTSDASHASSCSGSGEDSEIDAELEDESEVQEFPRDKYQSIYHLEYDSEDDDNDEDYSESEDSNAHSDECSPSSRRIAKMTTSIPLY
ncbi:Vacuolar protein sorting-associated protein 64 [Penicillium chermesinum]|nr:Vacuolar protein sorting-associated protein 64 [Penicillium chermesinum]